MRKLLVAMLVIAIASVLAVQALAATRSVKVGDDYFIRKGSPRTITVHRGDKVTWRFTGSDLHNIAVSKGPAKFHSSYKTSGVYSHTMSRVGTYTIICTIHQPDMRMKIRVIR
jgi:plastocyanin